MDPSAPGWRRVLVHPVVLVAAFGYFVDVFDLVLFGIVRVESLLALGVPRTEQLAAGIRLANWQMLGMLVGGLLWGVLGDRRGRVAVLFGSIFLYSAATALNAFAMSLETYAVLRFVAGVGLAGELGAGVTLVMESVPALHRGYATALIAAIGIGGGIAACLVGSVLPWKHAYLFGGAMGFVLLFARVRTRESLLFLGLGNAAGRGDLRLFFRSRERLVRFVACIVVGVPIWFVLGLLVVFAPEMARELGVTGPVTVAGAVLCQYLGAASGDLTSGYLSHRLRSRRKVVLGFLLLYVVLVTAYLFGRGYSPAAFYLFYGALGFATGYWAVFITLAAEQFGTNLRATAATTIPNFVRATMIPLTLGYQALRQRLGFTASGLLIAGACTALALVALALLRESFGRDLDYREV